MRGLRRAAALLLLLFLAGPDEAAPEVLPGLDGLVRTPEEREADLARAFGAVSGDVSEEDRGRIELGLRISKRGFLKLYRDRWRAEDMPRKLERTVNAAFEEQTRDLMPGTAAFHMAADDNIIEAVQNAVNFKFSPLQEEFLGGLETEFGLSLRKEIRDFYNEMSALMFATAKNPMLRAAIRDEYARLARSAEQAMMDAILVNLRESYPDLFSRTGAESGVKAAVGIGLLLSHYLKKRLAAQAARTLGKKVAKHSLGKIIGLGIPILGWGMMAWSVYDFYALSQEAKEEARQQINEMNQELYYTQAPEVYWDKMEPFVLDNYILALSRVKAMGEQAEKLARDPRIVELSQGLSEIDKMVFAERMAAVVNVLGGRDYEEALENFAPFIRDASPEHFERFLEMLQWNSIPQILAWSRLAGEAAWFDLYAAFPRDLLSQFSPSEDSLASLSWMARNLTPEARTLACSLPAPDLAWLREELPTRFAPQLFGEGRTVGAIHEEIARLSALPSRESRTPWMGRWGYFWARYSSWALLAGGLILALALLRPLVALGRLFHRKERVASAPAPVVINLAQPAAAPTTYSVRLWISPALAPSLGTISWNLSQAVLPCEDGSDARILTVNLESLEDIARWVARNPEDIRVLQPEALRRAVENLLRREG